MPHKITRARWEGTPPDAKRVTEDGKKMLRCFSTSVPYVVWREVEISDVEISPLEGLDTSRRPWYGNCEKKPWEYKVTAVIPCLRTPDIVEICIELLRLQTVRPFIMVIDTGSLGDQKQAIESLRNVDCEVHLLQLNGVRHPSDYVAMAMDTAFTLCRSPYLFATHADCFLRRRDFLEDLIKLCEEKSPVVGYQLTPRPHDDWKGMVSHTATMFHMATMDKIGFGWSLRRLCNLYGITDYSPIPTRPNWPDTEILGNYILRKNNIVPHLIGDEENGTRTLDENIDHFRSYTSGKLYSASYFDKAKECCEDAKRQARKRIENWKNA